MAVISETSDDRNKKPKEEEENQNKKKLKGLMVTSPPIPDELTIRCLALIRRCDYLKIAFVSSTFRDLVSSPELYAARSIQANTEPVLYALIQVPLSKSPRWYILHRKPYKNTFQLRLGKIKSLPPMPYGSAVVTIGPEIYLIGGCVGGRVGELRTSEVTLIDSRSNTCRSLPRMNVARFGAAAGVIDGKIYVVGGCEIRSLDWIEVFDVKKQIWSGSGSKWSISPNVSKEFCKYAVIEEKIYISDERFGYVYEPKEDQWKSLGISRMSRRWDMPSCVVDDMLFCMMIKSPINVYDMKEDRWRPVKGLQGFPADIDRCESKMANFGGKLVVLGGDKSGHRTKYKGKQEMWYVEIGLERREGGEIWGNVESVAVVLTYLSFACIDVCQTVMV